MKDFLNLKITQENLPLILLSKVQGVARIYAEEHNCSILEGARLFAESDVYRRLEIEETKLWWWGPVALYQEWMDE